MLERLLATTKPALIVIEMQVGIADPDHSLFKATAIQVSERGIVARIVQLAAAFRAAGHPVFFTPCYHRADFADVMRNSLVAAMARKKRTMVIDTIDAAYMPGLEPQPEDHVSLRTSGLFAMLGTDLDVRLRRMGVETIVATGVSTNLGVIGMCIAGVDFGYNVIVPEDCIAGSDPQVHRTIVDEQLRLLATITHSTDILAALGQD